MLKTPNFRVVLVTAPDAETARTIVRTCLDSHLAACANILPGIESHYWWKGCLETAQELLIIFKTTADLIPALERHVLLHHPYETPEFVSLPIAEGSSAYLQWLQASVKGTLPDA